MPQTLSAESLSVYAQCIQDLHVDNLGVVGTRLLLTKIGILDVSLSFMERVIARFPCFACQGAASWGAPSEKTVHCYAEYDVEVGSGPLAGALLRENGLRGPSGPPPRWLRATALPISAFVNRELCAEFQLLEATCEALARALAGSGYHESSRAQVHGSMQVLVTGASCMSCVGAFRQFQLLWPGIRLSVGTVRVRGIAATFDDSGIFHSRGMVVQRELGD
eukprot:CAMPEP_0179032778 /NCGR_PEP_ID=MMETSP0796-20121207/11760_1 /TAXON_ID=73915 /ORGANISM="Pyrodinium bahamense, Strain pbaha01" /LENGTH=220 /DNA_ID=CAMNT_0020729009 /DNA_START=538 /DNA_END=1200 /DNA_ORIENTATION=+